LVILVPGGDKILKIRKLFEKKKAFEVIEAVEVFEAAKVIDAAEVSKARKIISEVFKINQVLEFNNLMANITLFLCFEKKNFGRIMRYQVEFWYTFCQSLWRPANVTFLKIYG
jgi:hypothetical protein